VLGKRVWDCQHKFRLVIGPLGYEDYQRMLPGGASMRRVIDWVKAYAGTVLDWDVRLVLKRREVPPLTLGAMRLGWTTYLASGPAARDARQLLINPTARPG
jgi:type VI secretion system protein ImpH